MSRHRSRHRAVQVLFQCDVRQITPEEAVRNYYGGLYSEESGDRPRRDKFMEELVEGASGQRAQIDALIESHSPKWRVERMPAVDRNIMRLAAFELMQNKLPGPVIIDEALELARRFSGDESVKFINAVLDAIRRELPESKSASPSAEEA